ncbi:MAG: prepilin-type N-terminal cleavage/methylation domain-containing protein [Polyangiales bacterium]
MRLAPPRLAARAPLRSACAGFTLVELLVVILVIVSVAAFAAPSLSNAFDERRTNQAAVSLARLAGRARAASVAQGRAYLLRFNPGESELGEVQVIRGINNGCNTNDWDALLRGPACGEDNSMCMDRLRLDVSAYRTTSTSIRMRAAAADGVELDTLDLCYEPSGRVRHRAGEAVDGGRFLGANTIGGGYVFTFVRRAHTGADSTENAGVNRRVLLPLDGDARLLR